MRRRIVEPPVPLPGLDPARVAEVVVTSADGEVRRGSGFLVAGGAVLTAWHLVAGAATVRLRLGAGTAGAWSADGGPAIRLGESDAVLVTVRNQPGVIPVAVGRFAARRVAINGEMAGYPRWKLRRDDGVEPIAGDRAAKHRELAVEPGRLCPRPTRGPAGSVCT